MILFLLLCLPFLTSVTHTSYAPRSEGTTLLKYKMPTRGLLGLRNVILTVSRGTAVLNTIFDEYGPWAGDLSTRDLGSLVIFTWIDTNLLHWNKIFEWFYECFYASEN